MRHTAATIAARNGASVKDLQLMFAWKTSATVFVYVKGDKDERQQAMSGIARSLQGENNKIISISETA